MKARYYELSDRSGMMQKLGRDWIIEKVGQVSVTFGGKGFGRQVMQGSVDADRAMTDAEIQNSLSRSLQKHQGEVESNFADHMRQG